MKIIIFSFVLVVTGLLGAAPSAGSTIVVDKINGIYWQDDKISKSSSEDWDDAVLYCQKLKLDGLEGWRLPTFEELLSIVDYNRVKPAINAAFEETKLDSYWTSTEFSSTTSRAWTINFATGITYYSYKTTNHAVRCVKDMK